MKIDSKSLIQRCSSIVSSEIDGETVMMDNSFEKYFGMKAIGPRIWQLLENETNLQRLCEELVKEFDVSPEQCMEDIIPFLQALSEQDMIQIR